MNRVQYQHGFTLVEMVMVIVILGVIGGMVSVFMKGPIDAYIASGRRAGLTDVADTTVRRIARDLRKALPNSIRTSGTTCMEFIPTKTGGRYRESGSGALAINSAATSFNMLGSNPTASDQTIVSGDLIVVYNLGITGSDAYLNVVPHNRTAVNGPPAASTNGVPTPANETTIPINVSNAVIFPLASGGNRFHVVPEDEQVVGYTCTGVPNTDGSGTLYRYIATLPRALPASCPGASGSVMATKVSTCTFTVADAGNGLQRSGLISMTIGVTDSSETVTLQHEVHVNNTP
jgi:MSHA biogenesis protein MshO